MSEEASQKIVNDGLRAARNLALDAAVELVQMVADHGGCAHCCVAELEKFRDEQRAIDQSRDLMAKVFKS